MTKSSASTVNKMFGARRHRKKPQTLAPTNPEEMSLTIQLHADRMVVADELRHALKFRGLPPRAKLVLSMVLDACLTGGTVDGVDRRGDGSDLSAANVFVALRDNSAVRGMVRELTADRISKLECRISELGASFAGGRGQ